MSAVAFSTKNSFTAEALIQATHLEYRLGNPTAAMKLMKKLAKPVAHMEFDIESFEEYVDYLTIMSERDLLRSHLRMSQGNKQAAGVAFEDAEDNLGSIP